MRILLLIFLLPLYSYSQSENGFEYRIASFDSAAEEIYADILDTENRILIPFSDIFWVRADGIICLSGIQPKRWDHQYSGISFKPTFEDLNKWKIWFEQNKQNIHYSTEPEDKYGNRTIVFEYEKGKFRRNDCLILK